MLDARPPLSYLLFVSIQSSLRSVTIADTGPSGSSARRESRTRFVSLSLLCGRLIRLRNSEPNTRVRKGALTP